MQFSIFTPKKITFADQAITQSNTLHHVPLLAFFRQNF